MKKMLWLSFLFPATLLAANVQNVTFNSESLDTKTYDVWCSDGSHGYVNINEAYIGWVSDRANGSSTPYNVSFDDAARKICGG